MGQPPFIKKVVLLAIASVILFSVSKNAFSMSHNVDPFPVDPALALSTIALDMPYEGELSIDDLSSVEFELKEAEQNGASEDAMTEWLSVVEGKNPAPAAAPDRKRLTIVVHKVRRGESIERIASKYGVTAATIMSYNDLKSPIIQHGVKLKVPNMSGAKVTVRRGESLWVLARRHRIKMSDIMSVNGIGDPDTVRFGRELFLPGAEPHEEKARSNATRAVRSGKYHWPVPGARPTSPFGYRKHPISGRVRFHAGLDYAAPTGTPIKAVLPGRVIYSGRQGGYGYCVDIQHNNGLITRYAHASRLLVKTGQQVSAGQVIAKVGSTGISTGPHLHLEIIRNGRRVDPAKFIGG